MCGVDSKEIASNGGVLWVLVNFISVFLCSLRLRFERFFCLGVSYKYRKCKLLHEMIGDFAKRYGVGVQTALSGI